MCECECEWRGKLIKEAMKGGSVEVREEGVRGGYSSRVGGRD